jgi:hypothetical protein
MSATEAKEVSYVQTAFSAVLPPACMIVNAEGIMEIPVQGLQDESEFDRVQR